MPNPQAGGPSLVGCLRLLIQYIHSYPPYLEGISIRSLRTRHAVVISDPPNMMQPLITESNAQVCKLWCHDHKTWT
jgi:hypothetical protein